MRGGGGAPQYKRPIRALWSRCHSLGQCVVADTIMERRKCLFGVVVVLLACDVAAWHQWVPSVEKVQPQRPLHQPDVPPPTDVGDRCQVEEDQRIRCGAEDVAAEECDKINCCFDGSQCFYGKAGKCCDDWARSCTASVHGECEPALLLPHQ